ncbi:MAG: T9SS type A sorting domain-containing protein [candidate division Zixibacteria bacterium]|nr:T9SS type A sorting domain-containing protein [candidate division Zixibacteria bacterium]
MFKSLFIVTIILILSTAFALAQDPGMPDSLIIGNVDVTYAPGETLIVDIPIYFVTDDSIASVMIPLTWTSPDGNIEAVSTSWNGTFESWESTYSNESNDWHVGFHDLGGEEDPYLFTDSEREIGMTIQFRIDDDAMEQFLTIGIGTGPHDLPLNFGVTTGDMDQDLTPVVVPGFIRYGAVGIEDDLASLPEEFAIGQNYPNPFNPETNIEFQVPRAGHVSIDIYNLLGQNVRTLVSEHKLPGFYTAHWNGCNNSGQVVPSGLYFYRISADDFSKTKKMIMLK